MSDAYRCEKCKRYFEGSGYEINTIDIAPEGAYTKKLCEVCPRCFGMIVKFCHHKPRGRK